MKIDRDRFRSVSVILSVSVLLYANSLFNDFVFDDIPNVLENKWITDVGLLPDIFSSHVAGFSGEYSTSYYRPLIHVIYMACYHVFGYAPWGYHLVNVLFNAAASLLAYLVFSRLFAGSDLPRSGLPPPLVAGLLFAVHPVHTEAVAWVSGIMDTSFTFFYLLSFFLYMRSGDDPPRFANGSYLLSLAAFCLATLCKEPALTLPFLLAAHDWACPGEKGPFVRRNKRCIPYLVLSGVYVLARVSVLKGFAPGKTNLDLSVCQYALNSFPLFAGYLAKLILPLNLSPIHEFEPVRSIMEPSSIFGILIAIAFLVLCALTRRHRPMFLGLSLLVIPLLPAFCITAISGEGVFAERYLYLPSCGFAIVVAYLFLRAETLVRGKSVPATLAPVAIIAIFSIATVVRNAAWKDGYSLWSDAVEKSPRSAVAHQYLGYSLYSQGRIDNAIAEFGRALELNPILFEARFNLAVAYHSKGLLDQAIEQYRMVLKDHPGSASAHNALGMAYGRKGSLDNAVKHFEAAVELAPEDDEARNNLAIAQALRKGAQPDMVHVDSRPARSTRKKGHPP